jgi:Protein of unknown function (DUF1573)/Abnormal spindle-like microcephaly-assoc'd, ASPM-SPD-2-Hydin
MTPNSPARLHPAQYSTNNSWTVARLLMLLLGISLLVGCQGLSAGSPSKVTQPQVGNLSLGNASLDFGSVVAGTTKTLTVTATNSGSAAVIVNSATVSTNDFSVTAPTFPATIATGQSATFSLAFTPNAVGSFNATVTIASNASDSTASISLSGSGIAAGQLASNPSSGAFGSVSVGSQQSILETVTNTGGTSVTISQAAIRGTGFSLSGITAPVTVNAGQSTTFTLVFAPQTAGAASGHVTLTSNASNPSLTIPVSGTGIAPGQLGGSPASEAFGSVTVGSQQTASETVTNTGGTSVTISQAAVSGTGFTMSGLTTPTTLAAGQSASFTLTFAPQGTGSASGNVTLTSNGSNPTLTIPLSGTGISPGQVTSNPSSQAFGNVTVGSQQTASETITNTGGTSVTISQAAISGTGFSLSGLTTPTTLAAGQSASFTVAFAPQGTGSASGNVTLTSNSSNPTLTIPLSGIGIAAGQLTSNPSSEDFGSVTVGSQQTASQTITNTGGASVSITQATVSGTGFSLSGITVPMTLTAGQSATFTLAFSPQTTGTTSGNLRVTSNASNPTLTITLSGTGTAPQAGQLSVTPATLALGNVVVGQSGIASGSLSASGGSVTVTAASTNNSAFSVGGLSLPVTIPSGQTAPFSITFSPQTTAAASATLTITSNAQSSTITEVLTGTGTPAPTHSVNLSWTASTSTDVVGYNLYRALFSNSTCGAFAKINPVPDTATLYTDSTVANSTAYCYATTAVDTSNAESSYSNIVSNVAIP